MFLQPNKCALGAEKTTQEGRIDSLSPTKPTVKTYSTLRPYSKCHVIHSPTDTKTDMSVRFTLKENTIIFI